MMFRKLKITQYCASKNIGKTEEMWWKWLNSQQGAEQKENNCDDCLTAVQSIQSMTNSETCYFAVHDHKSTVTDSNPRDHSKLRNSWLFHQLRSAEVVNLVYTPNLCDCPYIPTRRPGTMWNPRVLWLKSSFSGRSCSSRAFVDIDQGISIDLEMV